MIAQRCCSDFRWLVPTLALVCACMVCVPRPAQAAPQSWLDHLKQAEQAVKTVKQIKNELDPNEQTQANSSDASGQLMPTSNADFEDPTVPSGRYTNFAPGGSRRMPGWTVVGPSGGNVSIISGTYTSHGLSFPAESGSQWLDLTGLRSNQPEGVRKVVATKPGTAYVLSFYVGNVVDPGGSFGRSSTVSVRINKGKLHGFTNSRGAGSKRQVWQRFTLPFVATSPQTVITFVNRDPTNDDSNGLDNVSVALAKPQSVAKTNNNATQPQGSAAGGNSNPTATQPAATTTPDYSLPADFATAAGTNRYAKLALTMPDVRGIRLGMTPQQARAALASVMPGVTVGTNYFVLKAFPKHRNLNSMDARVRNTDAQHIHDSKSISLGFTPWPSKAVVTTIQRTVSFTTKHAPSVKNTLAALRRKYGQPTYSHAGYPPTLEWAYDGKGHLVSPARFKQLAAHRHEFSGICAAHVPAIASILNQSRARAKHFHCAPWTILWVRLEPYRISGGTGIPPKAWADYAGWAVSKIHAHFVDHLLLHSSAEALRTEATKVQTAKSNKAKARASDNTVSF